MQNDNTHYFAIPAQVLGHELLSSNDKVVYMVVGSLSRNKGYCWASNAFISKATMISIRTIQQALTRLIKLGLIERKIVYKQGTREVDYRRLSLKELPNIEPEVAKAESEKEDDMEVQSPPEFHPVKAEEKELFSPDQIGEVQSRKTRRQIDMEHREKKKYFNAIGTPWSKPIQDRKAEFVNYVRSIREMPNHVRGMPPNPVVVKVRDRLIVWATAHGVNDALMKFETYKTFDVMEKLRKFHSEYHQKEAEKRKGSL